MRSTTPTLHCGGDDCTNWDVDYYAVTAHSVDGVRITAATRAPGWTSTDTTDLCAECVMEVAP